MIEGLNKIIDVIDLDDGMSDSALKSRLHTLERSRPRSYITHPLYLEAAKKYLTGTNIKLGILLDHPYGRFDVYDKLALIKRAYDGGAKEIYTVLAPALYQDRDYARAQEEFNLLSSFAKRHDIQIYPMIRPRSFSKDALSKIARSIRRYGLDTLVLFDDERIDEDDIITLRIILNKDIRVATILDKLDKETILYYARHGLRRFIVKDVDSFIGALYE